MARAGVPELKIARAEQMRQIDRRAIEAGIPSVALMQSAGEAFARACLEELGNPAGKRVVVVCGRGNNGGDGFVAARHLACAGAQVEVVLAGRADELTGDAAVFFAALGPMGVAVTLAADEPDVRLAERLGHAALIGDALLGTGARGAPEGVIARLITTMNASDAPIVACDIPSGVAADTGRVEGTAVNALRTVTFALPKLGLLVYPGASHAGRVSIADIGIPRALLAGDDLETELTTRALVRRVLPARTQGRDINKGTFGNVLVVAGSAGMAGAATLSALSALRTGAGLVQLAVPESVLDTAALLAPEVILRPLPETSERTHGGSGALDAALALAQNADAIALGPGMGARNPATISFVQAFVERVNKPLIIDADGLNMIAASPAAVRARTAATVLTPHPGEMGRLLGAGTDAVQSDRRAAAVSCAARFGVVALLKGARTLIAGPDGRLGVNRRGSSALATAGSGDVLTGVIGALLAQKLSAFDAARAGAYLHALAGEQAERDLGPAGVLAGEIRDRLPGALATVFFSEANDEL